MDNLPRPLTEGVHLGRECRNVSNYLNVFLDAFYFLSKEGGKTTLKHVRNPTSSLYKTGKIGIVTTSSF